MDNKNEISEIHEKKHMGRKKKLFINSALLLSNCGVFAVVTCVSKALFPRIIIDTGVR